MSQFITVKYVTLSEERCFSCYFVDIIACLCQCLIKLNPLFFYQPIEREREKNIYIYINIIKINMC